MYCSLKGEFTYLGKVTCTIDRMIQTIFKESLNIKITKILKKMFLTLK